MYFAREKDWESVYVCEGETEREKNESYNRFVFSSVSLEKLDVSCRYILGAYTAWEIHNDVYMLSKRIFKIFKLDTTSLKWNGSRAEPAEALS